MKKVNQTFKMLAAAIIVIGTSAGDVIAQPSSGNALWQPLGIDTVFTPRNAKVFKSLKVQGKIFASAIEVKNYLKVGDNAMWLVPNFPLSDDIRSDIGVIALMEGDNTTFSSNIAVGIGTQTPQSLLHLHQTANTPLFAQWTNGFTGATATDGFQVGIDANGIAEIRQQENSDMNFFTGSVAAPAPTGFSGLRFTDLRSSSQPEANPNGVSLSVDANGDVILVPGNEEKILALETRIAQLENKLETLLAQKN